MKNVKGKQCTILWHVENLNMSDVDTELFFRVLFIFGIEYRKITGMTITWGKIHK